MIEGVIVGAKDKNGAQKKPIGFTRLALNQRKV